MIKNRAMNGQQLLKTSRAPRPNQHRLTPPERQVRVFRPTIQPPPRYPVNCRPRYPSARHHKSEVYLQREREPDKLHHRRADDLGTGFEKMKWGAFLDPRALAGALPRLMPGSSVRTSASFMHCTETNEMRPDQRSGHTAKDKAHHAL